MSVDYPARFYAAVHAGNPGDIEYYRRACAPAASVLELGCGDARVLAALAEPGRRLLGVDLDGELLALAEARRSSPASFELLRADLRELALGERFERVLLPHGVLYCLLDDAALAAGLAAAARHLAPGGRLILDAWAADGFHAEADPDDQDPSWLERVKQVDVDGRRWEVLERSRWDRPAQRIDATYLHICVDGDGAGDDGGAPTVVEGLLRQRYLLADQLGAALEAAGLELVELAGGFAGERYDAAAGLLVAEAEAKPTADSTAGPGLGRLAP